jgi:hypothetical protein
MLPRPGSLCPPSPCCAAATWPSRPWSFPVVPCVAALLTLAPTRLHPIVGHCVPTCPACPASAIGGHYSRSTARNHARHAKLLLSPLLAHSLGLPLVLALLPRIWLLFLYHSPCSAKDELSIMVSLSLACFPLSPTRADASAYPRIIWPQQAESPRAAAVSAVAIVWAASLHHEILDSHSTSTRCNDSVARPGGQLAAPPASTLSRALRHAN